MRNSAAVIDETVLVGAHNKDGDSKLRLHVHPMALESVKTLDDSSARQLPGTTTHVPPLAQLDPRDRRRSQTVTITAPMPSAVNRQRNRRGSAHHAIPAHQIQLLTKTERRLYYFRHPVARLGVAFGIIFLNFLILAEDPQAHSKVAAAIPAIGNAFSLVATQWPDHGGYCFLKVVVALTSIIGGALFMLHIVHHKVLRPRFLMFSGDKGTWWVMFMGTIVWCLLGSIVYNLLLAAFLSGGFDEAKSRGWYLDDQLGVTNASFMKAAAVGTWFGDAVTAMMVLDMVLQTDTMYPDWHPGVRSMWNSGCNGRFRIVAFWIAMSTATLLVVLNIATSALEWDAINRGFIYTDEFTRGLLASLITMCDLLILAQDYDFPEFGSEQEIKLPGLGISSIKWDPFGFVNKKWLAFEITGKWFNYGIIMIVMLLDFNMLKNQLLYTPDINGQYTGPSDHVYTVVNKTALDLALADPSTLLTWEARMGEASGDIKMNARYRDYTIVLTFLAAVPAVAALVAVIYSIRHNHLAVEEEKRDGLVDANGNALTHHAKRVAMLQRIMSAASMNQHLHGSGSARSGGIGVSGSGSAKLGGSGAPIALGDEAVSKRSPRSKRRRGSGANASRGKRRRSKSKPVNQGSQEQEQSMPGAVISTD